jgi:hypothetical protein
VKSDATWVAPFRERYAAWWPDAEPLIAAHDYTAAFKTYPWATFTDTPWTPAVTPLGRSRLALVTTGGVYRRDMDAPFDGAALDGDASYREIPRGTDLSTLAVVHPHFNHAVALADMNTIFPLDRLEELVAAGVLGDLAPTHFATMGYAPRAADVAELSAPAIAARMRAEGVDVALIVPV